MLKQSRWYLAGAVILLALGAAVAQISAEMPPVLATDKSEQLGSAFTLYTNLYPQKTPTTQPSPHMPGEFYFDKQTVWSVGLERPSDHASIDVAFIEFEDNGSLKNPEQLRTALDLIDDARQSPNGAVVVVFTHGWFHGGDWTDSHFASFRQVLMHLAVREEERSKRRVVGIYLAWKGVPELVRHIPLVRLGTFFTRLSVAERIGLGGAFQRTISSIVEHTKLPNVPYDPNHTDPLVMVGHSMGALMLEAALLQLLRDDVFRTIYVIDKDSAANGARRTLFPDLILLLNSAADSRIAEAIRDENSKRPPTPHRHAMPYQAPLFISATSDADWATNLVYRVAKLGRTTDGNNSTLATHRLTREPKGADCPPKPGPDFGQSWHCLREPNVTPQNKRMDRVAIDLPQRNDSRSHCHVRYSLAAQAHQDEVRPFWFFKVPSDISNGHNDIFNDRSSLLIMALMQVSGAIMSLSKTYEENFDGKGEKECLLPQP